MTQQKTLAKTNNEGGQNSTKAVCRIIYDTGIPWHILTDEELTPPDVLRHLIEISKTGRGRCPWLK